jgi:hypothetical protein
MKTLQAFSEFMKKEYRDRPNDAASDIDKIIFLICTKTDIGKLNSDEDRLLFQDSCLLLFQLKAMFLELKPLT